MHNLTPCISTSRETTPLGINGEKDSDIPENIIEKNLSNETSAHEDQEPKDQDVKVKTSETYFPCLNIKYDVKGEKDRGSKCCKGTAHTTEL